MLIFFLLSIETAFGLAALERFVPRRALGPGFAKTNAALVFFMLMPAALFAGRFLPKVPGAPSAVWAHALAALAMGFWFAYFVAMNYQHEWLHHALGWAGVVAQVALIMLVAHTLAAHYNAKLDHGDYAISVQSLWLSLAIGFLSSGMLLGSVTFAMNVGHWYLVIPNLAIRWLKASCLVFAASLAFKAIAIGISVWIGAVTEPFGPRAFIDHLVNESYMLFPIRVIVGLIVPAILAAMAYKSAAIRATQSSTGILLPAMIPIFIGEAVAHALIQGVGGLAV